MKYFFLVFLMISVLSCRDSTRLHYERYGDLYHKSALCLLQKQREIFNQQDSFIQAISIYEKDLPKYALCDDIASLFKTEHLAFIDLEKDSTISYYSEPTGGLKTKQFILMLLPDKRQLNQKVSSVIKIKKINADGWYELEKDLSATD